MSRGARIILAVAVAVPFATGLAVALWGPGSGLAMESIVSVWVEAEVLVLVGAALIAALARGREDRRRADALRRLRERAIRDPMTGLLNRRGLVAAMSASGSGAQHWAVVLIDLDDFKSINDTHGHTVGDQVLIEVGEAVSGLERHGWLCARLGGDEFLLARRGNPTDPDEISSILDRVPAALRRRDLPVTTATAGLAQAVHEGSNFDGLIREADADLADKRGRTRRAPDADLAAQLREDEDEAVEMLSQDGPVSRVEPRLEARAVESLVVAGRVAAAGALLIGIAAVLGVPLDITEVRGVDARSALALTTSATITLAATALLVLLFLPERSPARGGLARASGAVVIVIGAVGIAEHISGIAMLPTRLVSDPLEAEFAAVSRIDIETGAMMILGGAYLTLIDFPGRLIGRLRTAVSIALIALIAAAFLGFALGVGYRWQGDSIAVSPQGTFAALLIAVALLAVQPRQPAFWPLTLGTDAARATRHLLLAGFALPLLSGTLLIQTDLLAAGGWPVAVVVAGAAQSAILAVLVAISIREVRETERESGLLHGELRELADRDPLTGLFNRGKFDRELVELLRHHRETGAPLSIALVDLDDLKGLNDFLGYGAGDAALRTVADYISRVVRPTDVIARMGGDEFGVILPAATREGAELVIERCAGQIASLQGPFAELTLSWGVAEAGPEHQHPDDLIEVADQRLYRAKGSH